MVWAVSRRRPNWSFALPLKAFSLEMGRRRQVAFGVDVFGANGTILNLLASALETSGVVGGELMWTRIGFVEAEFAVNVGFVFVHEVLVFETNKIVQSHVTADRPLTSKNIRDQSAMRGKRDLANGGAFSDSVCSKIPFPQNSLDEKHQEFSD